MVYLEVFCFLGSFFAYACPVSLLPFVGETVLILLNSFFFTFVKKSFGRICVGLFLGFKLCSIGLCAYPFSKTTLS